MQRFEDFSIKILGTPYTINTVAYDVDPMFSEKNYSGYCDGYGKRIVLLDQDTCKDLEGEPEDTRRASERATLRHEVVHAFFNESGLMDCSLQYEGPWSKDEELVDWIALQGEKIYKVWETLGCLG